MSESWKQKNTLGLRRSVTSGNIDQQMRLFSTIGAIIYGKPRFHRSLMLTVKTLIRL